MKTLFLTLFIIFAINIFSQPPDESPSSYTLAFEDEFDILHNFKDSIYNNYTNQYDYFYIDVDMDKWKSVNDWTRGCESPAFRQHYFQNTEIDTTGTGKITLFIREENVVGVCEQGDININNNYQYTNQMLLSKKAFKYGYYEIRFRIPQPPSTYPAREEIYGVGPNFWMFNSGDSCNTSWCEIDIFEIDGCHYRDETHTVQIETVVDVLDYAWGILNGDYSFTQIITSTETVNVNYQNFITHNVHFENCNSKCFSCNDSTHYSDYNEVLQTGIFADNNYHKVGMKWLQNSLTFYIDGHESFTLQNADINPTKLIPMPMIVDINFPSFGHTLNEFLWLPYKYEVDYVKVWSLNNCHNSDLNICNEAQINNYNNDDVYNEINVSGENCTPIVIESEENVDLKANTSITLKPGFHAKAGSEFKASIKTCETQIE